MLLVVAGDLFFTFTGDLLAVHALLINVLGAVVSPVGSDRLPAAGGQWQFE